MSESVEPDLAIRFAMDSATRKVPPKLEDGMNYLEWRNDLLVWELFTDLSDEQKGPSLYLSLKGKARDCGRELTPAEIGAKGGFKKLLDTLDGVFKLDTNTLSFIAFKEFYDYRRAPGVPVTEFFIKFEYLYREIKKYDMTLPEGVRAFFLLMSANLSEDNEKLARATCGDRTYDNMKTALTNIFSSADGASCSISSSSKEYQMVKQECVLESHEDVMYANSNYRGRGRGGGRGGGRGKGKKRRFEQSSTANTNQRRCFICDSTKHLAHMCPHKDEVKTEEIHITLFGADEPAEKPSLVKETFGKGVLDSGCTKNVSGKVWMDEFLDHAVPDEDKHKIREERSIARFRFGDGKEHLSKKQFRFPVVIGRKKVCLIANVVDCDIPLLLSRRAMKGANMIIDFGNSLVKVYGQTLKLSYTSSGHPCLALTKFLAADDGENVRIVLHTQHIKGLSRDEKMKKALQLHQKFGHATQDKLIKLVQESKEFDDEEFIEIIIKVCNECELCLRYKKAPPRPVVGLPLGSHFNDTVCMDLKEVTHTKLWILHLIDSVTCYSAAALITRKLKDVVIQAVFKVWIAYFGSPHSFLTDNGGEFSNEHYREMNEKLNVRSTTTAAESPFSNGMVERHNAILFEGMQKTMEDVGCEASLALAWSISAKNALQNQGGYSPNQLVFGRNTNTPSVLHNELPACEPVASEIVRKNLDALHSARENFLGAERSERIKRALRHPTRPYVNEHFENGEDVYYKRKNYKGWKGPAKVVGKVGENVIINHGGQTLNVHPCHLNKRKSTPIESSVENVESRNPAPVSGAHAQTESVEFDDETTGIASLSLQDNENETIENSYSNTNKPVPNSDIEVKYSNADQEETKTVRVLSKQPKRSGVNGNWVNVHVRNEDEPTSINWDSVLSWKEVPGVEEVMFLGQDEMLSQDVVNAKDKEYQNLVNHDVFESVPFQNQKLISTRWVITEKFDVSGEKLVKARIVARGFEEDSSNIQKDSPTCSRETLRLLLAILPSLNWEIHSLDVSSAFLQGEAISRNVFIRPPKEFREEGCVWKLKKPLYGLNDAPRSWYNKVKKEMLSLGAMKSKYDDALFIWHNENGLYGLLASHVDDFTFGGADEFMNNVIGVFMKKFQISSHAISSFQYIGLNVRQSPSGITVDQCEYIKTIEPVKIAPTKDKENVLDSTERGDLKRLAGQMIWVTSQTRPDVAFETCVMSNGENPTVRKALEANKALSKMKSDRVRLLFPQLGDYTRWSVLLYSDATHASLEEGASQGAFIVFVKGAGKLAPISWSSKKLKRVTKSSLASEALALGEGADVSYLVACKLKEIFGLEDRPNIQALTDSRSLRDAIHTSNSVEDKRLLVEISRLREMVSENEISVDWVDKTKQLADPLTKRSASTKLLLQVLSGGHSPV